MIRFRLCTFGRISAEMKLHFFLSASLQEVCACCFVLFRFCPVHGKVHLDGSVSRVDRFLHCQVTISPCVVSKLWGRDLETA